MLGSLHTRSDVLLSLRRSHAPSLTCCAVPGSTHACASTKLLLSPRCALADMPLYARQRTTTMMNALTLTTLRRAAAPVTRTAATVMPLLQVGPWSYYALPKTQLLLVAGCASRMECLTHVLSQQVGRPRLPTPPGRQRTRAAGTTAALPCRVRRLPVRAGALAHCTCAPAGTGKRASPLFNHSSDVQPWHAIADHVGAWRAPGGAGPRKRARITRGALLDGANALQLEIGIVGARDAAGGEGLEVRTRSARPRPPRALSCAPCRRARRGRAPDCSCAAAYLSHHKPCTHWV
jgi:hypothetical protein